MKRLNLCKKLLTFKNNFERFQALIDGLRGYIFKCNVFIYRHRRQFEKADLKGQLFLIKPKKFDALCFVIDKNTSDKQNMTLNVKRKNNSYFCWTCHSCDKRELEQDYRKMKQDLGGEISCNRFGKSTHIFLPIGAFISLLIELDGRMKCRT